MSTPQARSAAIVRGSRSSVSVSAPAWTGSVLVGVGRPAVCRHLLIAWSWVLFRLGVPDVAGAELDVADAVEDEADAVDDSDDDVAEPVAEAPQPARAIRPSAPGTAVHRRPRLRWPVVGVLVVEAGMRHVAGLAMVMAFLRVMGPLPTHQRRGHEHQMSSDLPTISFMISVVPP
jgi:hypothetical protein